MKWKREFSSPQLNSSNNRFVIFSRVIDNTSYYNLNNGNILREVIVKIGLERINMQEEVIVEVLLDNSEIKLVMSLEFVRK